MHDGMRRAVLSRRGRAVQLSRDHKPSTPSESARLAQAGGARVAGRPPRGCAPASDKIQRMEVGTHRRAGA